MKRRVLDGLYNIDRALASLIGAKPQETLSSEIGRHPHTWWGKAGGWFLNKIDPGHTERAVRHADALDLADDGIEK